MLLSCSSNNDEVRNKFPEKSDPLWSTRWDPVPAVVGLYLVVSNLLNMAPSTSLDYLEYY